MSTLRKPGSCLGSIVALVLVFAFVGVISSCAITIGIWPGQLKLLAPIFCSDAQPDAFVVADTYSPQPGETVTNFSLYCMGPRGDATDHGFMKPFLLISMVNGVVMMLILFAFTMLGRSGLRRISKAATSRLSDEPGALEGSGELEGDGDFGGFGEFDRFDDSDEGRDGTRPKRSPAPPGSTAGPFVD